MRYYDSEVEVGVGDFLGREGLAREEPVVIRDDEVGARDRVLAKHLCAVCGETSIKTKEKEEKRGKMSFIQTRSTHTHTCTLTRVRARALTHTHILH